ncbi:MAG: DNA polymerase III subunit alpha [Candidatus Nomurabacteria bacterium]|jgi:DNA polymerase-3 subunit alpha|nr:DNA polymerase III subunit alpha [Candidatus Nomurabacteria bacterium]
MGKEAKTTGKRPVPGDFVHLHNHTNYSVLDGLTRVDELCQTVKDSGMVAVAMTDHGTISGWIDLYKCAEANGIKPIFGFETYVAARGHTDRDPAKDKPRYHLTLLAMNNDGYRNIMRLSSIANLEGMYYKPRIDRDLLEKYNEGIICLSGCAGGEIGEALKADDYQRAVEIAEWHHGVFGDRYYLELQDHGHPESPKHWDMQTKINDGLLKIAKQLNIPAVLTCDAHYLRAEDADAHEILLCVGTGAFVSDTDRMTLADFDLHVMDPNDIIERWGDSHPEIIRNSRAIADRCQVTLDLGGILIPTFPCPDGEDEKSYLHKLVWQGLAVRYAEIDAAVAEKKSVAEIKKKLDKEVIERAEYELGVIDKMGFNGYFLIVWDFIKWGKDHGIVFGPGRGSAAGSIIAYALKITDLDPIEHDLLFERFLNPDRISMPDIDIDIQDTRRGEVIAYCTEKYGAERVSNIGTFGKMMARNAVRDVARVLEVPYAEADRLSKMVPSTIQGRHIPLKTSVASDADLKQEYDSNPTSKRVIDFATRLEGTIRSHGVHAAGVVIAPDELVKYAPVEMAQKGVVATQFPMGPIEELGLLKMDFLGLSNLTIINNAIRIVRKVYNQEIDLTTLPMDDEETYQLFQRGDTTGVFQLESAGMKRYLKDLKPTSFDDIIAMVALYRPGPMQFIDSFIRRKHGRENITYLDSHMEPALKSTYGILVYQEQFMQISKDMCGFTGGQADYLRKAVGKKKMDMMQKIKPEFIDGAIKESGVSRDVMEQFWTQLEEFANYCFNKSHAACYALIAYWTAYIKAHFPSAFMAALMTSDSDDTDRLAVEIAECQHMNIKVLLPDINESFVDFAVVPQTGDVRFGLAAVKGVGVAVVEEIEKARKSGGAFTGVEDYAKRVSSRISNRKVWESLIKAGAFDKFGDRSDLLFNLDSIIAFAQKVQKEAASGQADLFGALMDAGEELDDAIPSIKIVPAPTKYSEKEMLGWERELLGLYLSAHPLDRYDTYFHEMTVALDTLTSEMDGTRLTVGGVINTVRTIMTKNGNKMAFLTIEDKTGDGEIIVFSKLFEEIGEQLTVDQVVRIDGRVSGTDKLGNKIPDPKIIAENIMMVTDDELENYQSTGKKMEVKPAAPGAKRQPRMTKHINQPRDDAPVEVTPEPVETPPPAAVRKLYIHVRDPSDQEKLLRAKQEIGKHSGADPVVLVLGDSKNDALKMPFTTDANDTLVAALGEIYGVDYVVVK